MNPFRWVVLLSAGLFVLVPRSAGAQGFGPLEAARRMSAPPGFEIDLVAAEPLVRQPVAIEFDDRGRLWVVQYLQYPNPEGLKRVTVDRYSRTAYDRVPLPPPRGPRGADRITILEDMDGDGRSDRGRDFVSGLNLASGLAFGFGGVFVLQAPYLLFYADGDRDDRPNGDPEVLLTGFGMEDAHSVANSLAWGPDGWLYGLQGSTVTAKIRGIEFQQGVWRYHPPTRRFELFCEGGGNMWGLDFDSRGRLFASTNVGGFVLLHGVQGAYYWKSFGKHGPLHNPYTFGYFDHVRHEGVNGGHVSVGGVFYEADAFPEGWRSRYIAADLLDHSVHAHELSQLGSTVRACQVGDLLRSNDTWFAPSDLALGPDGALYVADWHDRRTAHPDPDAAWDRTNGRIFAIRASRAKSLPQHSWDLAGESNARLVSLLGHANVWYRRKARRLLMERRAMDVADILRRRALAGRGGPALEALWALHGAAGLDDGAAELLLAHADADVRAWCVRLLGDESRVSSRIAARLVDLANREGDVTVRAQLACTGRRLTPAVGLDIAGGLLARDLDGSDPHLPLLLWWLVEAHAVADLEDTLARFTAPASWKSAMVRSVIAGRLMQRLAAEKNVQGDKACARLIESAPSDEIRRGLLVALEEALRPRRPDTVGARLVDLIVQLADRSQSDATLTKLAARVGNVPAGKRARAIAGDRRAPERDRTAMLELLGELKDRGAVGLLIDLSSGGDSQAVRFTALSALGQFDDDAIASSLLAVYPHQAEAWRSRTRALLWSRPSWARVALAAIDRGAISSGEVTLEELGRFPALGVPDLAALVRKHWGSTRGATREERLAEVRRLNNDLRAASGDAVRGRGLFHDRCANCHRLHGEGETIGPDLTHSNRRDRDFLLVSLVDPAGVVRKEYQAYNVATKDGRVLTGLIVEQTPDVIVLRDAKGERTRVGRSDIEVLKETDTSLMPESLYKEFSPEQLRDLFRFLESDPPAGRKEQR
jgi:putative membrane-bound dehydrogenase-like protein